MYSFAQRADTTVVDEPLYAHYLRVTGREHPGREQVLESQDTDGEAVVRDIVLGPTPTPVVFFKMMAHHLVELDRAFLDRCVNILLTRDPEAMLRSLAVQLPDATLADTGLDRLVELVDLITATGHRPLVVDSDQLVDDPEAMLSAVCERIGIAFDPAMMSWPAGPKPEDGVWAEHWYHRVHDSIGFSRRSSSHPPLTPRLTTVLAGATPLSERLLAYSVLSS
jgi:hypothetical protein